MKQLILKASFFFNIASPATAGGMDESSAFSYLKAYYKIVGVEQRIDFLLNILRGEGSDVGPLHSLKSHFAETKTIAARALKAFDEREESAKRSNDAMQAKFAKLSSCLRLASAKLQADASEREDVASILQEIRLDYQELRSMIAV